VGREVFDVVAEVAAAEGAPEPLSLRPRSFGTNRLTVRERAESAELEAHPVVKRLRVLRPQTRGDCKGGMRPCPWVSCTMHLAYDVLPSGALKENFPARKLEELEETCAVDVADQGPQYLERIGELMGGITMEAVRLIEEDGVAEARALGAAEGWAEDTSEERLTRIHRRGVRRRAEHKADRPRRRADLVSVPGALGAVADADAQSAQAVVEEALAEVVPRDEAAG
jgi:hypothetical protein